MQRALPCERSPGPVIARRSLRIASLFVAGGGRNQNVGREGSERERRREEPRTERERENDTELENQSVFVRLT